MAGDNEEANEDAAIYKTTSDAGDEKCSLHESSTLE
jgi:hypothetical protein